jgi:hypothetical protein
MRFLTTKIRLFELPGLAQAKTGGVGAEGEEVLQCCYSVVTVLLQCSHSVVTVVLPGLAQAKSGGVGAEADDEEPNNSA